MSDYCKNNKIYSLNKLTCVDNTMNTRIINNKIYSSNPYSYSKIKKLEFLSKGEYGSVYKACFPNIKNKCRLRLVKKVDRTIKTPQKIVDFVNSSSKNLIKVKTFFRESYTLLMCNRLLDKKITQNLPYFYGYKVTTDSVTFAIEFANGGDFKDWLLKKTRTEKELDSSYFQIFHAAYCLNKYIGVQHNDLHWKNIIVFNVKKGGVFEYKIKNKTYYIQNLGFVFILSDFGLVEFTRKGFLPSLIDDTSNISYASKWSYKKGKKSYGKRPFKYNPETKKINKPEDIFNVFDKYTKKTQSKIIDTFTS